LISGVCDSTSPVKAKVRAVGGAAVVGVIETIVTDDVVPEVVEVQPVVIQANTKSN
jgi:hypothetical protein